MVRPVTAGGTTLNMTLTMRPGARIVRQRSPVMTSQPVKVVGGIGGSQIISIAQAQPKTIVSAQQAVSSTASR